MLPPCLAVGDDLFPQVRAAVARRLAGEGWSQMRVARALGISQAMVSRHVATPAHAMPPLARRLAEELHADVAGRPPGAGPRAAAPAPTAQGEVPAWCSLVAAASDPPRAEALSDLLEAEAALRAANPIRLVPQIGLNLARSLAGAKAPGDVLAFPGRIVEAGGRLVSPAAPAPGGSGHLARCLLHVQGHDATTLGMASARGGPPVRSAARGLGWHVAEISGRRGPDMEAAFRRAVDRHVQRTGALPDAVHDPGAVGLEPCLYVPGPDARAATRKLLQLDPLVNP